MKLILAPRLRPLELPPGRPVDVRAHLARRQPLNCRARWRATWRAAWKMRWAFLLIAVLTCAATLTCVTLFSR